MQAGAAKHHLSWGAQALWDQLNPLLPGLEVQVLAHAGSTNTLLVERVRSLVEPRGDQRSPTARRADDAAPMLLVAEHQTHGRGRQGRGWIASAGSSLTFSLALRLGRPDWSGLSLAVGVALADALDPLAPGQAPRLMLKWPNDLMLLHAPGRGRKLGGILVESVGSGSARFAVIGVGLNVQPQPMPDTPLGYACLQEMDPGASAPATLARLAPPLVRMVQRFDDLGFAALREAYAQRDLLQDQPVSTTQPGLPEGRACGVADDGALRLDVQGTEHRVTSGEVSVRLAL
jgi:BirA family biotin operon repressor/biotin-[acetyl-CoA-carboxylase] ligase